MATVLQQWAEGHLESNTHSIQYCLSGSIRIGILYWSTLETRLGAPYQQLYILKSLSWFKAKYHQNFSDGGSKEKSIKRNRCAFSQRKRLNYRKLRNLGSSLSSSHAMFSLKTKLSCYKYRILAIYSLDDDDDDRADCGVLTSSVLLLLPFFRVLHFCPVYHRLLKFVHF